MHNPKWTLRKWNNTIQQTADVHNAVLRTSVGDPIEGAEWTGGFGVLVNMGG